MKTDKAFIILSPAFAANEADTIWLPWLQTLVTAFNRNYPELSIIVFAFHYPHTIKKYKWHDNKIIPLNGTHTKNLFRLTIWLKIFFEIRKIKKQFSIVGVFSMWCGECTLVAKHVAKIFQLKYLCWILGQDARESNTMVKRIRPEASSLVAMSDFLADEFYKNHHIKPQHVIPDGVDITLFNSQLPAKDIDIVGAGSLSTLKQYNIFVDVVYMLKQQNPNIKTVLCGDGEEGENIKAQIKKSGLEKNIILMGTVDHATVLQTMQRAKILLHPSSYEGFGTVCVEALYAGSHVISFVQPMHHTIKNWHIVTTKEEMKTKALEILQSDIKYEPVLVYSMDEIAKKVMHLFGYS